MMYNMTGWSAGDAVRAAIVRPIDQRFVSDQKSQTNTEELSSTCVCRDESTWHTPVPLRRSFSKVAHPAADTAGAPAMEPGAAAAAPPSPPDPPPAAAGVEALPGASALINKRPADSTGVAAPAAAASLSNDPPADAAGDGERRASEPTTDMPSPPELAKRRRVDSPSASTQATSPDAASALQQLRQEAYMADSAQAAAADARVEKWMFDRWYSGTVIGPCEDEPVAASSSKTLRLVHFEGLPPPSVIKVDINTCRLLQPADPASTALVVAETTSGPGAPPMSLERGASAATEHPRATSPYRPRDASPREGEGRSPGLKSLTEWAEIQRLSQPIVGATHGFAKVAAARSQAEPSEAEGQ